MKKSKLFFRLFALLLTAVLLASAPLPIFAGDAASTELLVTHTSPAIPADCGKEVDLSAYSVMMTGSIKAAADKITWTSDAITIKDGKVTPDARGVYALTASANGRTRTVYLVVKADHETEYVLYEEDFDGSTSLSDLGLNVIQCTSGSSATIKNGSLVLSAQAGASNYVRLLLPEWLGEFANYKFEANAAMTATQAANRWMSLMVRVQNNDYPYYQMAVRADATTSNGTEIALRNEKNAWEVQHTAPHTSKISDAKARAFSVEVYNGYMRTAIDGETLLISKGVSLQNRGRLGLQVRACEMTYSSIRVTLQLEPPKGAITYMAEVTNPKSNVILPPSAITEIGTEEALNALEAALSSDGNETVLPATAIFGIDRDLKATVGARTLHVSEILSLLRKQVIPAFYIQTKDAATALAAWLKDECITDAFVISDDSALLMAVREVHPVARAVLDYRTRLADVESLSVSDRNAIRSETNKSGARICLLPSALADWETVTELQRLLMTVWTDAKDTDTARVSAIVSGANGVVTSDYKALTFCYTRFFERNTVIRPSTVIGHRGVPSLAPENTIAGSMLAYEKGATAIENDVYLTADGVVVVMHDKTLDRTTSGTGNIENYTYEQLKAFTVDAFGEFEAQPIPTLEDYLKTFKGLDVQIVIEIKSSNTAICAAIAKLVKEHGMEGQVNVIAFGTAMLVEMKRVAPELSVGYLTSTLTDNESNPTSSIETILDIVQAYDSTYNPSYNKGALGPNLLLAASHRGIAVLPWTINDRAALSDYFLYGTHGITTNYSQYFTDCVKRVTTDASLYVAATAGEIPMTLTALTYGRELVEETGATLILIEGDEILTYENGVLTATADGEATAMLSLPCADPNGNVYYVCTAPFTVRVGGSETTGGAETEGGSETADSTPQDTANTPTPSGCGSTVTLPALVLALLPLAVLSVVLKKRD